MLVILLVTSGLVLACVAIHYGTLNYLSNFLQHRKVKVRRWVAASILVLLMAHIVEVSIFALGYEHFNSHGRYGRLIGNIGDLEDETNTVYWYYSFVVYTSLGFGDITPTEDLRLLTAIETLTGLILIAWSASFIYMQMHRFWDEPPGNSQNPKK